MFATAGYGLSVGDHADFSTIFTLYSLSVAFYMPTLALSNSVAYSALSDAGMDTVKASHLSACSVQSVLSLPCGW